MDKRPRFSLVSWLANEIDLRPMGEPETTVEYGQTIAHGLYIPRPFGPGTDATVTIVATRGNGNDGGVIAIAIADGVPIVQAPVTNVQSGPRRMWLSDDDIQREID